MTRGAAARRCSVALAVAVMAVLVSAAPAQAHPVGIQAAVDYRTRVTAIVPALAGVRARYVADGSRLELRNDSGRILEVVGYQGEPMLQVRPDGVWQNTKAPSLYVDKQGAATNPAADAHAAPQWQRISSVPVARWQDHRALWHGGPPPRVLADPSRSHRVSDWRVPLRDGTATPEIIGTLDWLPPPSPGAWWAAVLLVAALIGALGLVGPAARSRATLATRAGLAGGALAVALATVGYPLLVVADNAEQRAGSIAIAVLSQALPLLVAAAMMTVAGLVLARREVGDLGLAVAGVCALFLGAANAALFLHPVAPITADGLWARLADLVALGGGAGLAVAGVLRMRRSMRSADRPAPASGMASGFAGSCLNNDNR